MTHPSVLFVCNMNSVRSPMAALLMSTMVPEGTNIDSAGIYQGWVDPFTRDVLGERGINIEGFISKQLNNIDPNEFDLVVAMTPEAASEVRKIVPREKIEFWPIDNPSTETGGQQAVLAAYRGVRDEIINKIKSRFGDGLTGETGKSL